jgi:hypothetical protein
LTIAGRSEPAHEWRRNRERSSVAPVSRTTGSRTRWGQAESSTLPFQLTLIAVCKVPNRAFNDWNGPPFVHVVWRASLSCFDPSTIPKMHWYRDRPLPGEGELINSVCAARRYPNGGTQRDQLFPFGPQDQAAGLWPKLPADPAADEDLLRCLRWSYIRSMRSKPFRQEPVQWMGQHSATPLSNSLSINRRLAEHGEGHQRRRQCRSHPLTRRASSPGAVVARGRTHRRLQRQG